MKQNFAPSTSNPSQVIGRRIKILRRNRNITGQELGQLLGLSQQHVSRIENGSVRLNAELLKLLSEVLDTTLFSLLLGIGYQPKDLYSPFNCRTYFQATSLINVI